MFATTVRAGQIPGLFVLLKKPNCKLNLLVIRTLQYNRNEKMGQKNTV